jgi:hypothetical protein
MALKRQPHWTVRGDSPTTHFVKVSKCWNSRMIRPSHRMIHELKSIAFKCLECLANFTERSINLDGCSIVNWLLSGWEIFNTNILSDGSWDWQRVHQLKYVASNLSESE